MNGALPTTIIVVGLAVAAYALLMTVLNRRVAGIQLAGLLVLEILLLILIGLVVAKLADGSKPPSRPTLIGYLVASPLVPLIGGLWGAMERSRWGSAVVVVTSLAVAILVVRLHQVWPLVIHV